MINALNVLMGLRLGKVPGRSEWKNVSIVRSKISYAQMMSLKEEDDRIEAHLCQLFVFLFLCISTCFSSLLDCCVSAPAAHFLIYFNKMAIWENLKNSSPLLFVWGGRMLCRVKTFTSRRDKKRNNRDVKR